MRIRRTHEVIVNQSLLLTMKVPALFRRREIWVPTVLAWVLALIMLAGASVLAVRCVHTFLAVDQPAGARLLVIEGWMAPEELDQAIARFRSGNYNAVITTGGAVHTDLYQKNATSYAKLACDYLVRHGIAASSVTAVPTPESAQERTYLSAVMVRVWLAQSGQTVEALDVFSLGVHSRRSRAIYRMAFGPDVRIGILTARPTSYDSDAWWKTSIGAKTVITEVISWIWTQLFFWPPAQGSHEEKWGISTPTQN